MKNRGFLTIPLGALLFVIPWLAVTLIANIGLASNAVPGSQPVTASGPDGGSGSIAIQPSMAQAPDPYELVAAAAIASAVAAVILIWRIRSRRQKKQDGYFWYVEPTKGNPAFLLALLGLLAAGLYGVIALSERDPTIFMGYGGSGGGGGADLRVVLLYLIAGAILASTFVGLSLFFSAGRAHGSHSRPPRSAGMAEQARVGEILGRAVHALETGSDYRTAILGCYGAICQILDRDGTTNSAKLTAREFEALIAERLKIGRTYLHEATLLFEKARYSADPVHEEDVKRSRFCLKRLGEQLGASRPDPGPRA